MLDTENLVRGTTDSQVSYKDALENYRKNTDWWIIFDTFDLPDSKGSSLWLSEKTSIPVETVTESLEGLRVLGLLKQTANGYEKIKSDIVIPNNDQSKVDRMNDHALISRQILNHLGEEAKGALRFASFASNIEIIAEMYGKINEAILEADAKSKKLDRKQLDNV